MNILNNFSENNNVISVSKKDENKFDHININFIDVDDKTSEKEGLHFFNTDIIINVHWTFFIKFDIVMEFL